MDTGYKRIGGQARAAEAPAELRGLEAERIVDLDVRDDLRSGREPFSRIMAARGTLPEGGVLRLRAIFEPVPLYAVMGRQGFEHWTERLADDDWRVWFYRPGPAGASAQAGGAGRDASPAAAEKDRHARSHAGPGPAGGAPESATDMQDQDAGPHPGSGSAARGPEPERAEQEAGDDVVILDVRGLEPPDPMLRTLEAVERLPAGGTLVQINARVPQFLLPQLKARGFTYEIHEQEAGPVRVFIRRQADA